MKRPLFSYYGFYPIQTWWMQIHCGNCHHEGQCRLNKVHYGLSLLAFIVTGFITYYIYTHVLGYYRRGFRLFVPALFAFIYVAYHFCKPQKYFCAKCGNKDGTPLKFHRYLNR